MAKWLSSFNKASLCSLQKTNQGFWTLGLGDVMPASQLWSAHTINPGKIFISQAHSKKFSLKFSPVHDISCYFFPPFHSQAHFYPPIVNFLPLLLWQLHKAYTPTVDSFLVTIEMQMTWGSFTELGRRSSPQNQSYYSIVEYNTVAFVYLI